MATGWKIWSIQGSGRKNPLRLVHIQSEKQNRTTSNYPNRASSGDPLPTRNIRGDLSSGEQLRADLPKQIRPDDIMGNYSSVQLDPTVLKSDTVIAAREGADEDGLKGLLQDVFYENQLLLEVPYRPLITNQATHTHDPCPPPLAHVVPPLHRQPIHHSTCTTRSTPYLAPIVEVPCRLLTTNQA